MRTYTITDCRPYLDGKIEFLVGEAEGKRPRVVCRARPAKGAASHFLANERDARRWIDECTTGGNLSGFQHELTGRRRFT